MSVKDPNNQVLKYNIRGAQGDHASGSVPRKIFEAEPSPVLAKLSEGTESCPFATNAEADHSIWSWMRDEASVASTHGSLDVEVRVISISHARET